MLLDINTNVFNSRRFFERHQTLRVTTHNEDLKEKSIGSICKIKFIIWFIILKKYKEI